MLIILGRKLIPKALNLLGDAFVQLSQSYYQLQSPKQFTKTQYFKCLDEAKLKFKTSIDFFTKPGYPIIILQLTVVEVQ